MTAAQVQTRSGGSTPAAVFMRGKSPGMVMASHDGKRILPTFKYTGGSEFLKKCIRDRKLFDRDMTELFAASGFGGEFHCSVHRPVKGNQHVRGLKLKSHANGVLIEANYGGTDDIVQMSVIPPVDCRDAMRFFELLRAGQKLLVEEDEDDALMRRASYGRAGDYNFRVEMEKYAQQLRPAAPTPPQEAAPTPAPVPETPSAAPVVAPAIADATKNERGVPFYKDITSLTLFMEELEKHANGDGYITRNNCLDLLRKEKFAQVQGLGSLLKGVIGSGHLTEDGNSEILRFGGMWLTAWLNKSGRINQDLSRPLGASGPGVETGPSLVELLSSIDTLTDEAARLRVRQGEITSALQGIEPNIARLKAELEGLESQAQTLTTELEDVTRELSNPKYAEAEQHLGMLQKLHMKKA